jgi:hypothetical protein
LISVTFAPRDSSALGVGGETVVLRRDRNASRLQVLHRLVAAAVAELELEGRAAERVREHLVAEADAEDREVGIRP